jgi:hypothetical protein
MKYLAPLFVAFSLMVGSWARGQDAPTSVYKPTITAMKDGQVQDRYRYRKEFDSLEACQEFVKKSDEEFMKMTIQLFTQLQAEGVDEVHLTCEPIKPKDTI